MTLDWKAKQKTSYCVPMWVRDEQMKASQARIQRRVPQGGTKESLAIACFGPSLATTWEELRKFDRVMTCSGSHRFLVERGITPTYHVEVDPRPHKAELIGPAQPTTQYLICSTCHRKVFDHLEGFDVALWHVFDQTEAGKRLIPAGEWALTGGCDVGLRSIAMAAWLGYRDLHIFGLDHSAGTVAAPSARRHAGEHPNQGKMATCEYEGVSYLTTPGMLEAARQLSHELDQLPDSVKVTFHGDGLAQHMQRTRKRPAKSHPLKGVLAFSDPDLITPEYRELNARLHRENLAYGVGGGRHAPLVTRLAAGIKSAEGTAPSVLDYGCGKGYLAKALPFAIHEYDPAIAEKSARPQPSDLVICTDVLEHVEIEHLPGVLDDLRRVTKQVAYFVVHTGPSGKTLADGRNAHMIQQDAAWWSDRLKAFFRIGKVWNLPPEVHFILEPKAKIKAKMLTATKEAT